MSKKVTKTNFRVIVRPCLLLTEYKTASRTYLDEKAKQYEEQCQLIADEIRENIGYVGSISIEHNTEETCSFCGLCWMVNENPNDPTMGLGEPFCCREAQEEWRSTCTT